MTRTFSTRSWIVCALACLGLATLSPVSASAATAGETLRQYLNARMTGDLKGARSLWDRREVRRSQAMGTRYDGIEARYDEYLLLSAQEREALATQAEVVFVDSLVESETAHFSLVLRERASGEERDHLRYFLKKDGAAWTISLPLLHDTAGWTRREGRFFRLRSKKLKHVNPEALSMMDAGIEDMLERFGTPPASRLRLERMKLEYFLCEDENDVRNLVGSPQRAGYLPGCERIVSMQLADLNAVCRAIVNLTLRKTPPHGAPFIEEGLAAAFGGLPGVTGDVVLQRASAQVARDPAIVESTFEAISASSNVAIAGLWCVTLLNELGSEQFMEMYRGLRGTAVEAEQITSADVLEAAQTASGKQKSALLAWLQEEGTSFTGPLRGGCEPWPEESRTLRSIMTWQDVESGWGMKGFIIGEDFAFAMGALEQGLPKWVRQEWDSLSAAHGLDRTALPEDSVAVARPEGDPPELTLLLRPRIRTQSEPFESPLFTEHFFSRPYVNEQFGLFVNADEIRLYDYRRGVLVAEYSTANAPPDGLTLYDRDAARMCFRLRRDVFPKGLLEYDVLGFIYTGE